MFTKLFAATIAAILALPAMASAGGQGNYYHGAYGAGGQQIVVSCYRGPWKEVIWDRPNPVFIDSLVAVGYDYASAQSIGDRVCRDPNLVRNPGALRAAMLQILRNGQRHY